MASPALDDCFLRELAVPDFLLRPVLPKAGDGPPDATGPPLLDSSAATGVEAMTRGWETMKISASPSFLVFLACAFRFEVGKSCCARPASRDPFSNLNHSRSFLPKTNKNRMAVCIWSSWHSHEGSCLGSWLGSAAEVGQISHQPQANSPDERPSRGLPLLCTSHVQPCVQQARTHPCSCNGCQAILRHSVYLGKQHRSRPAKEARRHRQTRASCRTRRAMITHMNTNASTAFSWHDWHRWMNLGSAEPCGN